MLFYLTDKKSTLEINKTKLFIQNVSPTGVENESLCPLIFSRTDRCYRGDATATKIRKDNYQPFSYACYDAVYCAS